MNRILVFLCCSILATALFGCEQQNNNAVNTPQPGVNTGRRADKFQTDESQKGEFPESLAGVWIADRFEWAFKFEPDGSILKLVHMVAGKVDVEEGGVYMEGPDEGTFAMFSIGPCETNYDPETRQLRVKTTLERFHMRLPTGDLEGWEEDYFDGPVSEDGKTWDADWRSYSWLDGAAPLDTDLIDSNPEKLIFSKIDSNGLHPQDTESE